MKPNNVRSEWVVRCHLGMVGFVILTGFCAQGHAQTASAASPTNATDLTAATAVDGFQPVAQSLEAAESGNISKTGIT